MSEKDDGKKKGGTVIGQPRVPQPGQISEEEDVSQDLEADEEGPQAGDPEQTSERALPDPQPPAEVTPVPEPVAPAEEEPEPAPQEVTPAPGPRHAVRMRPGSMRSRATPDQPPPQPNLVNRVSAWLQEWGLLCVIAFLCLCVTIAIFGGAGYGVYRLITHMGKKAAPVTAKAVSQPTPSATKPIPLPPKPRAAKPPVLICTNYTLTLEPDGSLITGPCECRGDDCSPRFVCQSDYDVYLHKETITNPDDTETTRVVGVEVDLSKCRKLKK